MIGVIIILALGLFAEFVESRGKKPVMGSFEATATVLLVSLMGYGAHALTTMFIAWVMS